MSRYFRSMRTVALSEAKDKLSSLVEEADTTHEIIRITRHGRGAAVLMSEDALESLHESLFWLSQQQVVQDVAEARTASDEGRTVGGEELRARFGLPTR
jgi:antitoxin YefM